MGYRLNRLDEPVFIAVSKPLLTEFDIHQRLESCGGYNIQLKPLWSVDRLNLLENPPLTTIWIFPGMKVGYSGLLIGGGVPRPREKEFKCKEHIFVPRHSSALL